MKNSITSTKKSAMAVAVTSALAAAMLSGCSMLPEDFGALADKAIESSSDETSQVIDDLTQKATDTAGDVAKQAIEEYKDKAIEAAKEYAGEYAKEATQQVAESAQDMADDIAKKATQDAKDAAQQAIEQAGNYVDNPDEALSTVTSTTPGLLSSAEDLNIAPVGDKDGYYSFTYDGRECTAIHTTDHWRIIDSYEINSEADMLIICQALIDLHQIHGKDMVSYRTADDMVYEWEVHNLAYFLVEDDDPMKERLKDVDFDPKDQGCTFDEIYYNHTGKELDLSDIFGG